MEIEWRKSKYGYELIEEYSDEQIALMKFDSDGSGEYYISCIDNFDTGRDYLNSNDLEESKKITINTVIEKRKSEIQDIQNQIEELEKLIN